MKHPFAGLWLPGQFRLIGLFAVEVFEEIRINLASDAGGQLRIGPSGRDWRRGLVRRAPV